LSRHGDGLVPVRWKAPAQVGPPLGDTPIHFRIGPAKALGDLALRVAHGEQQKRAALIVYVTLPEGAIETPRELDVVRAHGGEPMRQPAFLKPCRNGGRYSIALDRASRGRAHADRRSAKLRDMKDAALFLHLLGVLLFVAGIVLAGTAFETARRRERPAEIALLLGLTRIGVALVVVGGLLVPVFGLWLVHLEHLSYGAGWIDTAIALYVVALALGAAGGQRPKQARRLASRLAAERAPASAELRALLDNRLSLASNYTAAALVLAILALMVFKP
jgi:uncharacterized membrane protein